MNRAKLGLKPLFPILLIGSIGVQTFISCSSDSYDPPSPPVTSSSSVGGGSSSSDGGSSSSSDSNGSSSSDNGGSSSSDDDGSSSSIVPLCGGSIYDTNTHGCCNNTAKFALSNQRCENNIVETECGDSWFDASDTNLKCSNDIVETKCVSNWYDATKQLCDVRNDKIYKKVKIGAQTWMAENLNFEAPGSKCGDGSSLSDGNTPTCDTYGRLYNWSTATGVCPTGWYLPTHTEWEALKNFVERDSECSYSYCAGTKLKAETDWNNESNGASGNGTDDYGFSALPGGFGDSEGIFRGVGVQGEWWTRTPEQFDNNLACYWRMFPSGSLSWNCISKSHLHSVRCLQYRY